LIGVSDDSLRRWADEGRVATTTLPNGRTGIEGTELAALLVSLREAPQVPTAHLTSARNRFTGLVTAVTRDTVMAQVDLQAGPFRIVSLMSREAADQLGLEPGVLAVATVKATTVTIDVPEESA